MVPRLVQLLLLLLAGGLGSVVGLKDSITVSLGYQSFAEVATFGFVVRSTSLASNTAFCWTLAFPHPPHAGCPSTCFAIRTPACRRITCLM